MRSWQPLWAVLACLRSLLKPLWAVLARLRSLLGPLWAVLGAIKAEKWAFLEREGLSGQGTENACDRPRALLRIFL